MIPHDKCLHMIGGMMIFAAVHFIGTDYAIAAVVLAAFTKEFVDWYTGTGTPEWLDVLATIAGGAIGFVCTL